MTPFEQAIVKALGSVADELRLAREQRVRYEGEIRQKLDAALALRDEATRADMAQTNQRLTLVEKAQRDS
jgi:hypothetical protein